MPIKLLCQWDYKLYLFFVVMNGSKSSWKLYIEKKEYGSIVNSADN